MWSTSTTITYRVRWDDPPYQHKTRLSFGFLLMRAHLDKERTGIELKAKLPSCDIDV
jgi:hypothetical protein